MKAKNLKLFAAVSTFALGVAAVATFAANGGVQRLFQTKANSTRSVVITADQIGTAIGTGAAGNFVVDGLEWHVDGASYSEGVATLDGGTLYNVTFAGQSVSADSGLKGNGFTKLIIHNKDSKSGANFETRDEKDALITRRGLGAESQASYEVDFSTDNTAEHRVYRVFLAFGAGGGTSFTSIEYQYTCANPEPELTLSAPTTMFPGDTDQATADIKYADGTTVVTYASSNSNVVSVNASTGALTAVAAGSATISATFTVNGGSPIAGKNTVTITVTETGPNLADPQYFNFHQGETAGEGKVGKGELYVWYGASSGVSASENDGTIVVNHKKGGACWSTQMFFREPYYTQSGVHKYYVKFNVNSTVDGFIDVNNQAFDVVAGDNEFKAEVTSSAASTLYIMFGKREGDVSTETGTYTFSNIKVYDLLATRHLVKFIEEDGETIHDQMYVLNGQKIWRNVSDPTSSSGKDFAGWQVGGVDISLDTYTFSAATTVTSHFVSGVTRYNVSYHYGDKVVKIVSVISGQATSDPHLGYNDLGFGLIETGVYSDSGCLSAYDFASSVTADTDLYVTAKYEPNELYGISSNEVTATDTSYVMDKIVGGAGENWASQVNFGPIRNEAGYTFELTFEYRINHTGGHVQIYDSGNIGGYHDLTSDGDFHSLTISWDGDVYAAKESFQKLTFELGAATPDGSLKLELRGFSLVATAK